MSSCIAPNISSCQQAGSDGSRMQGVYSWINPGLQKNNITVHKAVLIFTGEKLAANKRQCRAAESCFANNVSGLADISPPNA